MQNIANLDPIAQSSFYRALPKTEQENYQKDLLHRLGVLEGRGAWTREVKHFTGSQGIVIRYYVFSSRESESDLLRDMLVVPGLSENLAKYSKVVEQMLSKGFRVWFIEPRCQGKSEGATAIVHIEPHDRYINDLRQMTNIIRADDKHETLSLYGHCFGAATIAAMLVAEQQEQLLPRDFEHNNLKNLHSLQVILSSPMFRLNFGSTPQWAARWLAFLYVITGQGHRVVACKPLDEKAILEKLGSKPESCQLPYAKYISLMKLMEYTPQGGYTAETIYQLGKLGDYIFQGREKSTHHEKIMFCPEWDIYVENEFQNDYLDVDHHCRQIKMTGNKTSAKDKGVGHDIYMYEEVSETYFKTIFNYLQAPPQESDSSQQAVFETVRIDPAKMVSDLSSWMQSWIDWIGNHTYSLFYDVNGGKKV